MEVREPECLQEQNLRFQGQYLDRETGLHYNTFRFYDPDVGRSHSRIRSGCRAGISCMDMRRIRRVGLIRWGGSLATPRAVSSEPLVRGVSGMGPLRCGITL